jgi:hypothetical protein
MTNARILLMRHAEKTGDPMDPHLSMAGGQACRLHSRHVRHSPVSHRDLDLQPRRPTQ